MSVDVGGQMTLWRARTRVRIGALPGSFVLGLSITAFMVVVALLGPHLVRQDPIEMNLHRTLLPPGPGHLLGTDNFGRDVLSRTVSGTSIDLQFGLFCVLPTFITGTLLGAVAGLNRWFDAVLMRVLDLVVAFPFYVVIIAIVAVLGPGVTNMYIAVMVWGWASYSRVVRNEVLVVKGLDYVSAATVLGLPTVRIIFKHLLPNVIVQPLVLATTNFTAYVLLGSALGFLGLGVQPPTPEWGVMIGEGRDFLGQAPWISIFPGLAILTVCSGWILLGDGLSDLLRPEISRK